jgi:hypothetical protein
MSRLSIGVLAASATVLLAAAAPGRAAEVTLQNDTAPPGTPCNCFIPGESAAAWLTASCTGDVVAVQAFWASQVGGAPQQIEQSIGVLGAGAFPVPGAPLVGQGGNPAVVSAPLLTDGVVNEFRFLDPPADTLPLRVPVSVGQTFVVALTYLNQSSGGAPLAPDLVYDADGCQTGLDAVNVLPGGWSDACSLGVTGDWALRAVVDCTAQVPSASPWGSAGLVLLLLAAGALGLAARRPGPG